jgi:MFS family permease
LSPSAAEPHARADVALLFAARVLRMFGYGFLSVVLVLYLAELGFSGGEIGLLFALTLAGDSAVSLLLTSVADRAGRRAMLRIGAVLMALAGVVFAWSGSFALLTVAAVVGVISPGGNEVGPFLAIEQAALSHLIADARRTSVFAWYNLAGSLAAAAGALASGGLVQIAVNAGASPLAGYRAVVIAYAVIGAGLLLVFALVSPRVEVARAPAPSSERRWLGLGRSRRVVLSLSALFALDAFAGGFVAQSLLAYWFHQRWSVEPGVLGGIFFGANILAGFSALLASGMAARFGLVNPMVWTHVPSNVLLILVPLMPSLPLAIAVLLARFSISQMDVPTRQSYTMAVVDPDERSAAAGVTGIARTTGAALSPLIAAPLIAVPALAAVPFFLAGGLKIVYDLALWRAFSSKPPPEEVRPAGS